MQPLDQVVFLEKNELENIVPEAFLEVSQLSDEVFRRRWQQRNQHDSVLPPDCYCMEAAYFEKLFPKDLKNQLWAKKFSPGKLEEIIEQFQKNPLSVDRNRKASQKILYRFLIALWHPVEEHEKAYKEGLEKHHAQASVLRQGRDSLFWLFKHCSDSEIQHLALQELRDLIEGDPIKMETASNLVNLQNELLQELHAEHFQTYNLKIQRDLVEVYAANLSSILLHVGSGHINSLTTKIKEEIWSSVEESERINQYGIQDPVIRFWSRYAIEASKEINTNISNLEAWIKRSVGISLALSGICLDLSKAAIGPESPSTAIGNIPKNISIIMDHLKHLDFKKKWFRQLFVHQRLFRHALVDEQVFDHVKFCLLHQNKEQGQDYFFGLVHLLEMITLRSRSVKIRQEGLKLLVQRLNLSSLEVAQHSIYSLRKIMMESQDRLCRNTSQILLRFIYEGQINEKLNENLKGIIDRMPEHSFETREGRYKQISRADIYEEVLKFSILELGDVKLSSISSLAMLILASPIKKTVRLWTDSLCRYFSDFEVQDFYGRTPYHHAARQESENMFDHIAYLNQKIPLHLNFNINAQRWPNGYTALHVAIENSKTALPTHKLLQLQANPNLQDCDGNTALELSCNRLKVALEKNDKVEIEICFDKIEKLLNYGAVAFIENREGRSAWDLAFEIGDQRLLRLIRDNNFLPFRSSFFVQAMQKGSKKSRKDLLLCVENEWRQRKGSKQEIEKFELWALAKLLHSFKFNSQNCSLLRESPQLRSFLEQYTLLEKHPPHSLQFDSTGKALFSPKEAQAIKDAISDIYTQKEGRSFEKCNDWQQTLIVLCCIHHEQKDLLKQVLGQASGQAINKKNAQGLTALHTAVLYRNQDALKLLLEQKDLNIDCKTPSGETALHLAAYIGDPIIIELLLRNNSQVQAQNQSGETALSIACHQITRRQLKFEIVVNERFIPPVVKRSIRKEALEAFQNTLGQTQFIELLKCTDYSGNTPLHLAAESGEEEIVAYLCKEAACILWEMNKQKLFAIQVAAKHNHTNTLKLLSDQISDYHEQEKIIAEKSAGEKDLTDLLIEIDQIRPVEEILKKEPQRELQHNSFLTRSCPLHAAAIYGRTEMIDFYQSPLDQILDPFENSPAHFAAFFGKTEFLEKLIDKGLSWRLRNKQNMNFCHLAARGGSMEVILLLKKIEQKSDPAGNLRSLCMEEDYQGEIPLQIACRNGMLQAVHELCQWNSEALSHVNYQEQNSLHIAALAGKTEIVRYLSMHWHINLEAKDRSGFTPLILAAQIGSSEVLKTLLELGADALAQTNSKETALHQACFYDHKKCVKLLLEHEKDLLFISDLSDEMAWDETPKIRKKEADKDASEILKYLLDKGAKITRKSAKGESCLHKICRLGRKNLLEVYINSHPTKSSFLEKDQKGNNCLHLACIGGHLIVVQQLLKQNISLKEQNHLKRTALHEAIVNKHWDLCLLLLSRQKKGLRLTDIDGKNALHLIFESGEYSQKTLSIVSKILEKKPQLINEVDKNKRNVLHILAKHYKASASPLKLLEYLCTKMQGSKQKILEFIDQRDGEQNLRAIEIPEIDPSMSQAIGLLRRKVKNSGSLQIRAQA